MFKIKITNWSRHNKTWKKSFKSTMIANNFCSDAKLLSMPMSHRWLFLALTLKCGEDLKDTITIMERQVNDLLTTKEGAVNALTRLQSFQLVTFEVLPDLHYEKKRIEKKVNEANIRPPEKVEMKTAWEG